MVVSKIKKEMSFVLNWKRVGGLERERPRMGRPTF